MTNVLGDLDQKLETGQTAREVGDFTSRTIRKRTIKLLSHITHSHPGANKNPLKL